tara:strand:+ start:3944 stop:5839 length:1896 start_codon:yes stop_codon:yes gene_type:complete
MKNYVIFFSLLCSVYGQVDVLNSSSVLKDEVESLKSNLSSKMSEDVSDENISSVEIISEKTSENSEISNLHFGYNYFKKDLSFFDNIPTPINYLLGPGDEISISMWGETNSRENYVINKDGAIFYENVGFINLSNLTLQQAKEILIERLATVFSTLQNTVNPTNLSVELGTLKSINIYTTGQVESPGINLVHPFSNIFTALVQSGGVKVDGSLRKIKHIRNGEEVQEIDFYKFFLDGTYDIDKEKLIDGDIIHVPIVDNRIKIDGEIINPLFYELKENETIEDLISFAGGFTSMSSNYITIDKIIPMEERPFEDFAMSSLNIDYRTQNDTSLNNGDYVFVLPISKVNTKVEVYGRVKNPGQYSSVNSSLKDILNLAGGFNDPIFRKTINDREIIILRQNENQFYGEEFMVAYNESANFTLNPGDKIFVYEDINYKNNFTYRVEGQVNKPGTYPLTRGITLGKAIEIAGGLTELSSISNISVGIEFTSITEDGDQEVNTELVADTDYDFELSQGAVITALPFENVVRVEGNVYNPGFVAVKEGRISMYQAIELAGGYKPYTLKDRVYVQRANGEIEKSNIFGGRAKRVFPGDTIFVPEDPNPQEFDITTFIADLSSTLANIAAILIIVDNNQ